MLPRPLDASWLAGPFRGLAEASSPSSGHTIWLGPVSSYDVKDAVVPGSKLHVIQIHNAADAAPLLTAWRDANGQLMPGLLAHLGIDPNDGPFFLGSFSAGHNIAKAVTKHPDDRALITALMLADSAQSTWADSAHTLGTPPQGYLDFASEAAHGAPRLLVASNSTFTDGSYASSAATFDAILNAIGGTTNASFSPSPLIPEMDPAPVRTRGTGNLAIVDYGTTISHEDHVHRLAPVLWQYVLTPWYQNLTTPGATPVANGGSSSPSTGGAGTLALVAGGVLVAAGVAYLALKS